MSSVELAEGRSLKFCFTSSNLNDVKIAYKYPKMDHFTSLVSEDLLQHSSGEGGEFASNIEGSEINNSSLISQLCWNALIRRRRRV